MSLSRRTFTKEFKEAGVRRLELGASVAEVARACEVNPNVLYRRRRELRKHAAKANLAASMVATDVDQLWLADITCIRLESEFVYLAVVLDA
jgi:transposase-like protein